MLFQNSKNGGVILATQILIPQVLFSGSICEYENLQNQDLNTKWEFPLQSYINQAKKISSILQNLEQAGGTVVAWFIVEETIKQREIYKIEQQLEFELQQYIDKDWDLEVFVVPGSKNCSLDEYRFEIEPYIHKLFIRFPFESFAQFVGFGETLPFQAIFLEGLSQFGDRYVSLYSDEYGNFLISTTQLSLTSNIENWGKQFRDFIFDHDYQAAFNLIKDIDQTTEIKGVSLLLQMMIDRFNFAFDDAIEHLDEAIRTLGENEVLKQTKEKLIPLQSQNNQIRDLNRVIELYRQLDIYFDIDDTLSFLIRFYRAREAVLYYLLQHAQTIPFAVRQGKNGSIYQVIDELEQRYDRREIDGYYGAYFYLKSKNVAQALDIRNQSFIGHGRKGIYPNQLWHSYFGTTKTTLQKAKRRYFMDTALMFRDLDAELDENIIDLNRYILQTVSKLFPKGFNLNEEYFYQSVD